MATNPALDINLGVEEQHRDIRLSIGDKRKDITLTVSKGGGAPDYAGPYRVIPILYYEQVLSTTGKRMTDDVTVECIPITETINEYGGKTVVIG